MLTGILLFLSLLFSAIPVRADPGFDEKYERDYNIFNPANRYDPGNQVNPDNPLNPANHYNPVTPFQPLTPSRNNR